MKLAAAIAGLGLLLTLGAAPTPVSAQAASAPAAETWSPEQWKALFGAMRHTQGGSLYEYRIVNYANEGQARVASMAGLPAREAVKKADSLADVRPYLRQAMAGLLLAGDTSQPVLYTRPDGVKLWQVLQLVRKAPRTMDPDEGRESSRNLVATWSRLGYLPHPDALLADPAERSRVAFFKANSAALVAAVPAELSADVEYGNYDTPLSVAQLRNEPALARALVAHGASVNRCAFWGCPLVLPISLQKEDEAMAWVDWLLTAGAKPELIDTRFYPSGITPLTAAIEKGYAKLAARLVAAGAPLDGVPGERRIPIEAAAAEKNRALVDWLIQRGASVLPFNDRSAGRGPHMNGNLYTGAMESGDEAFKGWAEQTMLAAARQSPRFAFDAFVEQAGKRYPLQDGASHKLKPAPFKLVLVMRPGEAESVTVGASLNKDWPAEVRRGDLRNPLFRPYSAAAMPAVPSPEAWELMVGQPCSAKEKADEPCPGVQMVFAKDGSERRDFHEARAAKHEYVREVRSLYDVSLEDAKHSATPLERLAGKTLHLVLSDVINLGGGADGQRLVTPRYVSLSF